MLYALYNILYFIIWILAWTTKSFFSKIDKGFQLRKKINGVSPWLLYEKNSHPIWIHCQSGEFEYALPIIRELKKQKPQQKIIVSYYTPSYVKRISQEPLVDFYFPLPWDNRSDINAFLNHHNPQQLLIARTGLWPNILKQCAQRKIPISLFSMTLNKKITWKNQWFFRWLFQHINSFYVVAAEDKNNLLKINSNFNVHIAGDSRYEQCLHRLKENTNLKISQKKLNKKVFICASTWPEDENALFPYIKNNSINAHWIVVPHEVDTNHIREIQKNLSPTPTALYSQCPDWDGKGVLIIDEFGILAALYKIADGAFIGGSFKSKVHSVMESLACGNLTFVGPYHTTNREAIEFAKWKTTSIAPVQILKNTNDVNTILQQLTLWSSKDKDLLIQSIQEKSNVSSKMVSQILKQ